MIQAEDYWYYNSFFSFMGTRRQGQMGETYLFKNFFFKKASFMKL